MGGRGGDRDDRNLKDSRGLGERPTLRDFRLEPSASARISYNRSATSLLTDMSAELLCDICDSSSSQTHAHDRGIVYVLYM